MSQTVEKLSAAYSILVFSIAFLGNITTVIVIPMFKDLQNATNFYILNLAIADLLISVTTLPSRLVFFFKGTFLTCKVTTFMWIFFFNASVFTIFFITVDRYVFICRPLYYRSNFITTRIQYWIAITWFLAFLLAILPFIDIPNLSVHEYLEEEAICTHKLFVGPWYLVFLIILTEIMPPFIFCLLYSKIITVARKHAFQIAIQFTSSKPATTSSQERRGCPDLLVSPFEDPSCLFKVAATDEEIRQLRRILFKNYDHLGQAAEEENLQKSSRDSESGECSEIATQKEKLSDVGRNLHEWKQRAKRSAERAALENGDQAENGAAQEIDSRKNCRNLSDTGPTQSGEPASHRSRRVTEHTRPASRPQIERSLSHGIVDKIKRNGSAQQSKEAQSKYSKFKARNRVRPFIARTFSKVSTSGEKKGNGKRRRLKIYKEFKAVKLLGMVVGMFILLHLPIALIDLVELCSRGVVVPEWILNAALLLTQASPAANTMIYVATKREFRYAFMRLWSCGRIKKRLVPC